jgi:toxin-antitoxin system PIN domain toxin
VIAIDTNVLVYAHRTDMPQHRAAIEALSGLSEKVGRWAIPWPCVHEFIAVCTRPAMGSSASSLPDALQAVQTWLSHLNCVTLCESNRHFLTLAALCERANLRGGAVHDARIAAICIDHGVDELWTCDRDFARFPDLAIRNPLIPSLQEPVSPAYRYGSVGARGLGDFSDQPPGPA